MAVLPSSWRRWCWPGSPASIASAQGKPRSRPARPRPAQDVPIPPPSAFQIPGRPRPPSPNWPSSPAAAMACSPSCRKPIPCRAPGAGQGAQVPASASIRGDRGGRFRRDRRGGAAARRLGRSLQCRVRAELETPLAPLNTPTSPWRHMARQEVLGVLRITVPPRSSQRRRSFTPLPTIWESSPGRAAAQPRPGDGGVPRQRRRRSRCRHGAAPSPNDNAAPGDGAPRNGVRIRNFYPRAASRAAGRHPAGGLGGTPIFDMLGDAFSSEHKSNLRGLRVSRLVGLDEKAVQPGSGPGQRQRGAARALPQSGLAAARRRSLQRHVFTWTHQGLLFGQSLVGRCRQRHRQ